MELNDILPPRESVQTSQGELFVESLTLGDLMFLEKLLAKSKEKKAKDLTALGTAAFKRLVSQEPEPASKTELPDEVYSQLTPADLALLAVAILPDRSLPQHEEEKVVEAFGSALIDEIEEHTSLSRDIVTRNFSALSDSVKSILGDNLIGLTQAQRNLTHSPLLDSLKSINENPAMRAIKEMQDSSAFAQLRALQENPALKKISEIQDPHGLKKLRKQLGYGGDDHEANSKLVRAAWESPRVDSLKLPESKPFEETPTGRTTMAVEESAKQLKEVVGLVGIMSERFIELHKTFLTEVIPQWVKNLDESADSAKVTFTQAERSLFVGKWALIASVVVTIGMTAWQLWIGHKYKVEDDKQQEVTESLMREQLAETRAQNKLLAEEISELRKAPLAAKKQSQVAK